MKVFVCKVKRTTVEEAVMYVEVPTRKMAKETEWLVWSESVYDTFEDYKETSVKRQVLSADQITSLCEVPETDRDIVPYNNPNFEPKEQRTLSDLLRPEEPDKMDDNSKYISHSIKMLEDEMLEIQKRIGEFNAMLSKRDGKAKA